MNATFDNLEMRMDEEVDAGMSGQSSDPLKTPYEIEETDFPSFDTLEEQYMFLLRYAALAPSSHNTQPWKCALTDAGIGVYADYTRRLPVADPGNRELLMSIGALLMNLRVAAARFGFECRIDYNYSGDSERPLAFVRLNQRAPRERVAQHLVPLFHAITKRHTNRQPFLVTRIPHTVVAMLHSLAHTSQSGMFISTDGDVNNSVARLVAEADRTQRSDVEFRKELSEWVRPNWTKKRDGIPGAAFGVNGLASAIGPWATRRFDMGRAQAQKDMHLCAEAPLLAVIHSEDAIPDLLETGELLERVWLAITQEGLYCSFFNMPIEVPELRLELKKTLGLAGWPQLLLRIGYSLTAPVATPRRPVEEIILRSKKDT